jgi:hypothetical protein
MSAPDIRPGDYVRVFANSGALTGRQYPLRRTVVLEVIAVGDPPGLPGWRYLSGRICRSDLTPAAQLQHLIVSVTGTDRSILNLSGMWRLLQRPDRQEEDA